MRPKSPRKRTKKVRFEDEMADKAQSTNAPKKPSIRSAPPKPVRLSWGPSTVRKRLVFNEIDAHDSQQSIAQKPMMSGALPHASGTAEEHENEEEEDEEEDEDEDESDITDESEAREEEEENNMETWQEANYPFNASLTFRLVKGSVATIPYARPIGNGNLYRDEFPANQVANTIAELQVKYQVEELEYVRVHIKSPASKAKVRMITMNVFSPEDWYSDVQPVMTQEWARWTGYKLDVDIKVSGQWSKELASRSVEMASSSTRPISAVDDPAASPARRKTRTSQQEEVMRLRRNDNEAQGNYMEALVDKWLCSSDTCSNQHRFCYTHRGKHYKLTGAMQEVWANAIPTAVQGASMDRPPSDLFDILVEKQGPVSATSRNPIALDNRHQREQQREEQLQRREDEEQRREERRERQQDQRERRLNNIMDLALSHTELDMTQSFASTQRRRQFSPYSEPQLPRRRRSPPSPRRRRSSHYDSPPSSPLRRTTLDSIPGPAAAESRPPPPQMAPLNRDSSPIDIPRNERVVLEDFWTWLINQMTTDENRQQIRICEEIVRRGALGVEDLKEISIQGSQMCDWANEKGLPIGLMRRFKGLLKEFKPVYRTVFRPGRDLLDMRRRRREGPAGEDNNQEGGFIREDNGAE